MKGRASIRRRLRLVVAGSALAATWLMIATAARAHDIRELQVEHEDGRYRIHATAWLDAPLSRVWRRLNDFDELTSLSPHIKESRRLTAATDSVIDVYTRSRYCVAFLCETVSNVERVTYPAAWQIQADVLAARSDLSYGVTRWRLEEQEAGTIIHYTAELEPALSVPPLIGPALIKRAMRAKFADTIAGLERRD